MKQVRLLEPVWFNWGLEQEFAVLPVGVGDHFVTSSWVAAAIAEGRAEWEPEHKHRHKHAAPLAPAESKLEVRAEPIKPKATETPKEKP